MFCPKCGSEMPEGTQFCTNCGGKMTEADEAKSIEHDVDKSHVSQLTPPAPVSALGADSPTVPDTLHTPQAASNKKGLIIGVVIAAVAIVAAIAIALVFLGGQEEQQVISAQVEQAKEATEDDRPNPTFQSSCFQVFLPANLVDAISFSEKNNTVTMTYDPTGTMVAMLFPIGEKLAGEMAYRSYTLGEVYVGGHYEDAELDLPYIEANNNIAHWGSQAPRELAVSKLLGITSEELIACIYVSTGSEYVPAEANMTGDNPGSASSAEESAMAATASSSESVIDEGSYVVPQAPFWGIWVGASKDLQEMVALAEKLKADGLGNAVIVNTADWSNLNSEPWWVVSLGHYDQEATAKSNLQSMQQHGYPNAYVKYSGEKLR